MIKFRMLMDDTKYLFKDKQCIGRRCWTPGIVQAGNTQTPCCVVSAAEEGCPAMVAVEDALVNARRKEGWVVA